jgi:hypothetical protein
MLDLCVDQKKKKLLISAGYFLLTYWHCSAGRGETKGEFIHGRGFKVKNIKEIDQNFKNSLDQSSPFHMFRKNHKERMNYPKRINSLLFPLKCLKPKIPRIPTLLPLLLGRLRALAFSLLFFHLMVKVCFPH